MKCIFNCKCTPAFNIIETVFADMKFSIRRQNVKTSDELLYEARKFLKNLNPNHMMNKIKQSLQYYIKAMNNEDF